MSIQLKCGFHKKSFIMNAPLVSCPFPVITFGWVQQLTHPKFRIIYPTHIVFSEIFQPVPLLIYYSLHAYVSIWVCWLIRVCSFNRVCSLTRFEKRSYPACLLGSALFRNSFIKQVRVLTQIWLY